MVKWALFYFSLFLIFRKQDCGEALVLFHQQAKAAQTISRSQNPEWNRLVPNFSILLNTGKFLAVRL